MRVLGFRANGVSVLYIVAAVLSLVLVVLGAIVVSENDYYFIAIIVSGLILFGVSVWTLVDYYSTPKEAIILLNEDEIQIGHGIKVDIDDITDVSYRRASASGLQYRWGSVTVYANGNKYKVKYLEDCERVAKVLTSLMYEKKIRNTSQQIPTV